MTEHIVSKLTTTHHQLRSFSVTWPLSGLLLLSLLLAYLLFGLYSLDTANTTSVDTQARQQLTINALTMGFEKNLGQTDSGVAFITRAPGYTLYLAPDQATVKLHSSATDLEKSQQQNTLQLRFVGAAENIQLKGRNLLPGRINYLHGSNNWQQNIPRYQQVLATDVYPGIDVIYYGGKNQQLEYDLRVKAGANPKQIGITYHGADELLVDDQGNLLINLSGGQLRQLKPLVYQIIDSERHLVEANYTIKQAQTVGINLAAYDPAYPLVIDPVLEYASFIGGANNDLGLAIAVDDQGAMYLAGSTQSLDFPTQLPHQNNNQGDYDIFIAKLNAQGDALEYATYIGGSKRDQANAIALDDNGNVYLAGMTQSESDFPLHNAQQSAFGQGKEDAFALKLSADGSELIYSTYLGGLNNDKANAIALDNAGNAYIAGATWSGTSFPTKNPIPNSTSGELDLFYLKLDSAGVLQYASLLGGSKKDLATGIALDASNNIYITGHTDSDTDFPLVAASQSVYGGGIRDAFILAINPEDEQLIYASYYGGTANDLAHDITADNDGNIYLTGYTTSPDLPLKQAWQSNLTGQQNAFVARFDSTGQLSYSTYFGGNNKDAGSAIALDVYGAVTITGYSASTNNLSQFKPLQTAPGGGIDAFIARLDHTGTPVFISFLGGNKNDQGHDIVLDPQGLAYLVGGSNIPENDQDDKDDYQDDEDIDEGGGDEDDSDITPPPDPLPLYDPLHQTFDPNGRDDTDGDDDNGGNDPEPNTLPLVNPLQAIAGGGQDAFVARIYINSAPQITSAAIISAVTAIPYQYPVIAEDADGDPLTYALLNAPSGMVIDPASGIINWPSPVAGI